MDPRPERALATPRRLLAARSAVWRPLHRGLGERVSVTDSDHTPDGSGTHYLRRPLTTTPVSIGSNVLVSAGVTILRGARLGANAVVAAGAVVRGGEHAGGWVHAGVRARPVRPL